MLQGCREWQAKGLRPPASVRAATEEYFEAADAFRRWADDCLVFDPNASITKADAFASWKEWAEWNGEYVGFEGRLRDYLIALPGVGEKRLAKARARSWIGVGLPPEEAAKP